MSARSPIIYDRPLIYSPPKTTLEFIHKCDEFLIVDKPAGLLSVPGKGQGHEDCLESRVKVLHPTARIVHRLDLATSGVMVMAQTAKAHRHLGMQFERRHTAKTYIARIWGHPEQQSGTIDLPLRCDWPNRPRQMVDPKQGKSALTHWQVLGQDEVSTRVKLHPETGRSHQLRVHMLALGHPILGDQLYAPDEAFTAAPRLCLHAQSLTFHHPEGGERVSFTTPVGF